MVVAVNSVWGVINCILYRKYVLNGSIFSYIHILIGNMCVCVCVCVCAVTPLLDYCSRACTVGSVHRVILKEGC